MPVPAENLLGKEGEGFDIAMANLDVGRIGIGAQAWALPKPHWTCCKYAKEREQFGKPIAANKGLPLSWPIWQRNVKRQNY